MAKTNLTKRVGNEEASSEQESAPREMRLDTAHRNASKAAKIAGKTVSPASVNGETLDVNGIDGVTVNGANVVTADIACTNGVIHVIDTVLLPKG